MKGTNPLKNNWPKLTQKEMENLKSPVSIKEINTIKFVITMIMMMMMAVVVVINCFSVKKTSGLDSFTGKF